MRRLVAVAFVAAVGLLSTGTAVSAEPGESLNREVSGPFTGTSFFEFTTHGCSLVYQAFDLTYKTAKRGTGTFHADTCGALGDSPTVTGTFVLTTAHGATLAGAVNGTICSGCPPLFDPAATPFELVLTPSDGSKALQHATGTILVDGTWNIVAGTITGTVEGALVR